MGVGITEAANPARALKRLAIVCFEDPRSVTGGVQRRVAAEIAYFSERGTHVTVLCAGSGERVVEGNVLYVTVPTPAVIYPVRTLLFSARAARLLRLLGPFDLVETHHDAGAAGLLAFRGGLMGGARFVEVVHGVFRDEFSSVRRYERLLSKATLAASGLLPLSLVEQVAARRADAVVTVSRYGATQVARRYGVRPQRVSVVPNGIDLARYSPATAKPESEECEVVCVGRWHARKGVLQLLRAFSIAHTAVPNMRLTFIGGGPLEATLHAEAASLGIAQWVNFSSGLSDDEIIAAYRRADIVCVPSLQEGQGIVALEAQACGAPIIATMAGGLPEAVAEDRSGKIVKPGNVQALAAALVEMALSSEMRRKFSEEAVHWASSFGWPQMLAPADALYNGLVRRRAVRQAVPAGLPAVLTQNRGGN